MKLCQTCKYWVPPSPTPEFGKCTAIGWASGWIAAFSAPGWFCTHESFGCTLHEEKE